MSSILEKITAVAETLASNKTALSDETQQVSYSQLIQSVGDWSGVLKQLNPRVIAFYGANSVNWAIFDLACQQAQCRCIPLPTFFSEAQVQRCITDAGVDTVVTDFDGFAVQYLASTSKAETVATSLPFTVIALIDSGKALLPEATQKITFTSGSTGKPKGVCLSVEHQWQTAQALATVIDIEQPKHLCLLPLSTLLENLAGIYSPLLCGGHVVLASEEQRGLSGSSGLNVFALLACIEHHQPNTLILIPQLLMALVAACKQGWQVPSSLSFIAVGGGKVSPDLLTQAQACGLPIYQGYGLSECCSVVALNTPANNAINSVGHVLPHCRVVVENNEIVVSGASFLGYMNDEGSWYPSQVRTGDLGHINDAGNLHIDGRCKNIIITSFGRNISPEWVEAELVAGPILQQCMVVGDAKPYLTALIGSSDSTNDSEINAWVEQVNAKLPDYARVKNWLRFSTTILSVYTTPNGRLLRAAVLAEFSSQIETLYSESLTRINEL